VILALRVRPPKRSETFEAEATPHLDALHRTAARLLSGRDGADDLVQEALLKAYRFFHTWTPGTNFKAWLFRVLYTTFVSGTRAAPPKAVDLAAAPEPTASVDELLKELDRGDAKERERAVFEAVDERIKRAVDDLPEDLRTVFVLNTVEDLKYREIADVLDVPLGTVMSRLFRARRRLQDRLAEFARDEGVRCAGDAS
jgi:RNA polymerase sigma-70 factor, ECF subfamily